MCSSDLAKREADEIVERARKEAKNKAEQARIDLKDTVARKLKAAEERIAQAEANATREVRNAAASAAVTAAASVMGSGMGDERAAKMIDDGIETAAARLG